MTPEFTKAEAAELNDALSNALPESPHASFASLVRQYRSFVASIPGYRYSIYDYDNDVAVRVSLDRALNLCTPELRAKGLAALEELDQVFLAQTVQIVRKHGTECPGCTRNWYERLPAEPGEELRSDIEQDNV